MTTRLHRWTLFLTIATLLAGLVVVGVGRAPDAARAADAVPDDIVTVTGTGTMSGVPDVLRVTFSVRVARDDVQSALDGQATATRKLLRALRDAGVENKDLQTTDLNLYRNYDRHGHPIGYVASTSVQARITPIDDAGATITAGATSSSHVEVGGLDFELSDPAALVKQARDAAYADAKARAEQYAELSGRTLGRVEVVNETVNTPQATVSGAHAVAAAAAAPGGSPTPIRAGRQTVKVRVNVIWNLT